MSSAVVQHASSESLLEQGRLDELLWRSARNFGRSSWETSEGALYAGIAAHHLEMREVSRTCLSEWARFGAHHGSGPLVSLVISDAVRPEALTRTLADIAGQLYRPLEAVVVGNRPETSELTEQFRGRVPIRRVSSDDADAWRAEGALAATGAWVGWLDENAELYPHHVGHLIAFLSGTSLHAGRARTHGTRPSTRPAEHGSGGRYDVLLNDTIPLTTVLVETSLAQAAAARAGEDADAWRLLVEICAGGPIEASGVPTSRIEDVRRPAPQLLRSHVSAYHQHLPQSIRIGGTVLQHAQRSKIRDLVDRAALEVNDRRVLIVVLSRTGDDSRSLGVEGFSRPGDKSDRLGPEILPVHAMDPEAFRRLQSVCSGSTLDYVAIVDGDALTTRTPGWLTSALIHLEADPGIEMACPSDAPDHDAAERLIVSGWTHRTTNVAGPILVTRPERIASADPETSFRSWTALSEGLSRADQRIAHVPVIARDIEAAPTTTPPLVVLCYHRVLRERGSDPFDITVSSDTFSAHLDRLARDYRVVSEAELLDGRLHRESDDPRTRVLITLDDGYRDSYETAAPLLTQHALPAVLFVTTGAVDGSCPFWWESLARSGHLEALTQAQRSSLQREWRLLPPAERNERLRGLGVSEEAIADIAATWPMLRQLHEEGRVALGAHTRFHSSLGRLKEPDLNLEIGGSLDDIEDAVGERPRLFAFPHGSKTDVSDEAVAKLVEEGCAFAFTTTPGVIEDMSTLEPGTAASMTLPRLVASEIGADELSQRIDQLTGNAASRDTAGKSIVVLSGITAHNVGDDAMLIATVRDLVRLEPNAHITVLAEEPMECDFVGKQVGVPIQKSLQLFVQQFTNGLPETASPALEVARLIRDLQDDALRITRGEAPEALPAEYVPGFESLVTADGVVDCGGANLSAHWKSYFYEKCIDYFLAPSPLFVLGQGVDRFEDASDRELLARALSKTTEVTCRERETESYLSSLGVSANVSTTGDDALTLRPASRERRDFLLRAAGADPDAPYLAFQFRHYLDYQDERYLTLFALIVDEAVRATGLPVVGVPMHFSHTDERDHLAAVFERAQTRSQLHLVPCELTPADAKSLFEGSRLTFGISYHSAILALSSETPFVGLYHGAHYEQKMKGLAELYGLADMAVPIREILPSAIGTRIAAGVRDRAKTTAHLRERNEMLEASVVSSRKRFLDALDAPSRPPEPDHENRHEISLPLEPVSRDWGFDRGLPIDRFYIERFLERSASLIKGDVCELLNDTYAQRFGAEKVARVEVVDIDTNNPDATLVADLTEPDSLGTNRFDCFLLTQTLPYIYDCGQALRTAYQSLRPGGVLLVTVPSIIKFHREPEDHWRFTPDSITRLVREHCSGARAEIDAHGNLRAAVAFLSGMAVEDVGPESLGARDPEYPLVVTARVFKEP